MGFTAAQARLVEGIVLQGAGYKLVF